MQFLPTPAGTYRLQRIQKSPDGELLDASGRALRLSALTRGKITLLTFFYSGCDDALGCPFARGLMSALRERILSDAELRSEVRFVSISFDPSQDTPDRLRHYAGSLSDDPRFEWRFLTASSAARLQPVLDGFGQDLRVRLDDRGRAVRTFNHMLKLFLIDAGGTVREIYALDFLHLEVMVNDMRTLRREAAPGAPPSRGAPQPVSRASQPRSSSGAPITWSAPQLARSVAPPRYP